MCLGTDPESIRYCMNSIRRFDIFGAASMEVGAYVSRVSWFCSMLALPAWIGTVTPLLPATSKSYRSTRAMFAASFFVLAIPITDRSECRLLGFIRTPTGIWEKPRCSLCCRCPSLPWKRNMYMEASGLHHFHGESIFMEAEIQVYNK